VTVFSYLKDINWPYPFGCPPLFSALAGDGSFPNCERPPPFVTAMLDMIDLSPGRLFFCPSNASTPEKFFRLILPRSGFDTPFPSFLGYTHGRAPPDIDQWSVIFPSLPPFVTTRLLCLCFVGMTFCSAS